MYWSTTFGAEQVPLLAWPIPWVSRTSSIACVSGDLKNSPRCHKLTVDAKQWSFHRLLFWYPIAASFISIAPQGWAHVRVLSQDEGKKHLEEGVLAPRRRLDSTTTIGIIPGIATDRVSGMKRYQLLSVAVLFARRVVGKGGVDDGKQSTA